ncbi:phage protein [Rhizobium leguminosarum bv. phaseoli CCGM1]|uniref:head decoration protein n=1 Tax=Rhizobium phaseoli TaxID=396 RepID=UPI0004DAD7B2|nr:head decoration protein [Rhizobium phaseoli]KEC73157.1 phage protein [Rhizobium leguminosarum bv. phaseoli CCGM1]PWI54127.1 head decoration protein [Rhizobium phaseoli]
MTTLTMGERDEEFILSEANGQLSRSNATLKSGENLKAGTLLKDDGTGKLIAATGSLNTAGDLVTPIAGILCRTTDATGGDVSVSILDKDAEVKDAFLTYPTETTAGGEKAASKESLLALGIKVR